MNLTKQQICEEIKNFDSRTLIKLNNIYSEKYNYMDSYIYYMDDFNDMFEGRTPLEIVGDVSSNFNTNFDFFKFNGYGLAESFDFFYIEDMDFSVDSIAEDVEEDFNSYKDLF